MWTKFKINALKKHKEVDANKDPIKSGTNDSLKYETKSVDPELKSKRKKTIIKWVIALLIIGLFIGLIVWSCTPTYRSIKVNDAIIDSGSTQLKLYTGNNTAASGNANYVVEMDSTKNGNASAYYYVTMGGSPVFMIITHTVGGGDIEFRAQVFYNDMDPGKIAAVNVGGSNIKDATALDWFQTTTSNGSIPSNSPDVWYIILQMLPMLLIVGLMIWSFSRLGKMSGGMGQGEESIFGMGKSQAKIATSNVRFADVAGIEEEKAELIEIVDYLKNPEIYAAMGARTPRGVMLYGPPGTGKTLLAKAVAGEASVPFFQASGSSFEDMLVGVGAKRVRSLFAQAKKAAPSIIFIDEIDSVASKRGKGDMMGGSGLADQTINQLLAEMDGFNTRTGVVVMAATNRLDVLDDAILRPGRFDRHIQVNLPDIKEREAILKIHSKNKNLSSKVRLDEIARRTPGFSGAQLENVLNEATLLAVREKKTVIGMQEMDEAIDRVIAGPSKKSRVITEDEKKQIAYHEAGHALVGLHTPSGDVVEKITIIPRGQAAGYTLSTPLKQELSIQKKSDLLGMIRTTLGGRAAEFVKYGPEAISTGASNDLYKITNIVRSMVTQLGMSSVGMTQFIPSEGQVNANSVKLYSNETAEKIDKAIEDIIQSEYKNAIDIVKKNSKELDLIVETLIILETIVKSQIDYIHKHLELPKEAQERKEQLIKDAKKAKEDAVQEKKDNLKAETKKETETKSTKKSSSVVTKKDDSKKKENDPSDIFDLEKLEPEQIDVEKLEEQIKAKK